jgi:biotin operon repressor
MNEEHGFIKIYRNLLDWEWWGDHNTTRLFLYCLLAANWKDKSWQGHRIKRGQFVTSLPKLAKKTGLSREQVRTALKHLILTGNLTDKTYSKFRIITVKNYDAYQDDNRQDNSQVTVKQQASNSQVTPTKERKKERKEEGEEGGEWGEQ